MRTVTPIAAVLALSGCAAPPTADPPAGESVAIPSEPAILEADTERMAETRTPLAGRNEKPISRSANTPPPPAERVGRYMETTATPDPGQMDLLSVVVRVTFPETVTTVGEAVRWLLIRSGYRLLPGDPAVRHLFRRPLPEVHRQIGPVPLRTALAVLAGEGFRLREDPVRRTIKYAWED
ncbi:PFGI-1 class ICE element type IV pilus protein PilL2 [Methylohalobius crimeensis]|uniref:PFGI-1 class ICE element type IV pilus protein PilL2 n=1 Tax=Methylohalobius crimeensis TaxID=244365 RepID=UPI0003B2E69D|nr:pili assembly chaperone [Methylohalobius crimeensis]